MVRLFVDLNFLPFACVSVAWFSLGSRACLKWADQVRLLRSTREPSMNAQSLLEVLDEVHVRATLPTAVMW